MPALLLAACVLGAAAATATTTPPPRPRPDPRAQATALLESALAGDPSIAEVQRAAEQRAAPSAADGAGWRRRARVAAMLPRLVAEYRHDERSFHEVGLTSTAEVDYVRASPGDTVLVRLDWSLEGLVFGRNELAAATAAESAASHRLGAAERATRLYYERLRLRVALAAAPPGDGRARAEAELELASVTAQLDALTGLYGEAAP
jgi:hypothetical protein